MWHKNDDQVLEIDVYAWMGCLYSSVLSLVMNKIVENQNYNLVKLYQTWLAFCSCWIHGYVRICEFCLPNHVQSTNGVSGGKELVQGVVLQNSFFLATLEVRLLENRNFSSRLHLNEIWHRVYVAVTRNTISMDSICSIFCQD